MGSCVSLSRSPPADSTALPELEARVAKVVDLDGSMAKFDSPVTARDTLPASGGGSCFLCSSDELGFDAPPRALDAEELLQPGQLYFVLPASVLRRPLSGQDMAALAVKATRALAVEAGIATGAGASPSWRKKGGDGKVRKKAGRVAPVLEQSGKEITGWSEGASKQYGYEFDGERTMGKTRNGVRGARRRRAGVQVQRLSAIAEGSE